MSRDSNTSVSFWLQLPLREFICWIEDHNELVKEENHRIENERKRAKRR